MKTLYLDIEFNTDEHYSWNLVPTGTQYSYDKFEYHACEETFTVGRLKDDISWIVDKYKKVIEQFMDNVVGEEANIVQDILNGVLNHKDWNKSFDMIDNAGHGTIRIKFYIDTHSEKQAFTLYLTPEQKMTINAIAYQVEDYYHKKDEEIVDGVTDIIVSLCKKYLDEKYEKEFEAL